MTILRAGAAWVVFALVGMLALSSPPAAHAAATRTWTGLGANSNWSDAGNWDTGVPVAGDSIVFPAGASRKTNTNNLAANTSFARIDFTGSGYDISGNALELTDRLFHNPGSGTNSVHLSIMNDGAIEVDSGRLVITGNNTFDGIVSVDGGVLQVASSTGLGTITGITDVDLGGILALSGGIDIGAEPVYVVGGDPETGGALQSLSGTNRAGIVRLVGDTVVGVGNSTLIIGTLFQDSPGAKLTLIGGGKLQVEAAFYAGELDVDHGNLTWNANSQAFVDVDGGGWLRGTGTVAAANVMGGQIWPGSGNAPGVLTVMNKTTFGAGYFKVDIDGPGVGTGYGRLATGSLELGTTATFLDVDLGYTPVAGTVFTIIANGGGKVVGTFTDLPEGASYIAGGYVFRISYVGGDGNDVTLTALRTVRADLRVTATAAPSPAQAGNLVVYTVTLTNDGPDAASSPRVSMGTPEGTTFESVSGPNLWACSKPTSTPSASCTGPTFASGATATFTFTYRVNQGRSAPLSGTVGVSSETSDPASANNATTLLTQIGAGGAFPFRRILPGLAADK
jgi:uncharacterized repeat protein (TIGR01451 family)